MRISELKALFLWRFRLKKIADALDEPNQDFFSLIAKHDLKKNIEYFVNVFENVLKDERKQVSLYNQLIFNQHAKTLTMMKNNSDKSRAKVTECDSIDFGPPVAMATSQTLALGLRWLRSG